MWATEEIHATFFYVTVQLLSLLTYLSCQRVDCFSGASTYDLHSAQADGGGRGIQKSRKWDYWQICWLHDKQKGMKKTKYPVMDVISEGPAPIRQRRTEAVSLPRRTSFALSHYFPFKGSLFHTGGLLCEPRYGSSLPCFPSLIWCTATPERWMRCWTGVLSKFYRLKL